MKKCLKDEATAKRVDAALDAAGIATALQNKEIGLREAAEKSAKEEREKADDALVKQIIAEQRVTQLEKRPTLLKHGLIVFGGTFLGVAVGIIIGALAL